MNCPKCGSIVNQGETFCRMCGTKVNMPNNIVNNTQPNTNTNMSGQQMNSQPQPQVNPALQSLNVSQNNGTNMSGQQVNSQPQPQVNPALQSLNISQNNIMDDDELIDAYIGKNADKFRTGKFSIYAFFLGISYYLYRKMWIYAFMIVVMTLLFPITGAGEIPALIIAINFKKYYLQLVAKEVEKIKKNNPTATFEQLKTICAEKGGTSLVSAIVGTIVFVFIIILFA